MPRSRTLALASSMRFLFLLLLIVSLGPITLPTSLAADDRPNLIVFLVDDMGVMDSSVPFLVDSDHQPVRHPLNDFYRTPNLERLAAQGIRFSQFNAMSVCSPSRLTLMTGMNAARHRTTNWIRPDSNNRGDFGPTDWNWTGLKPTDVTLPRLLQSAGYRTIHIGKGHFGPTGYPGSDPTQLGFDVNVAGTSAGQPGNYYGDNGYGVPGLEKYHGTGTFLTEALTQEALHHVDQAIANQQPFFLNFAHYAVHAPFNADPRFAPDYTDSGKPPQAQAFATLIAGIDQSLGKLLDHLQQAGVADNTLIFFLGDNGTDAPLGGAHEVACAAPLRGKKGSHYEGGMRAPLIVAWAADNPTAPQQKSLPIPHHQIQTQLVSICDLFPTLLQVAQVAAPAEHNIDGFDLSLLLTGASDPAHHDSFLMHYPHGVHRSDYFTVYREGDWKVVYHYRPTEVSNGSHYELFHLTDDPYEQVDRAGSEPLELRRMMEQLAAALRAHDALLPVDEQGNPLEVKIP